MTMVSRPLRRSAFTLVELLVGLLLLVVFASALGVNIASSYQKEREKELQKGIRTLCSMAARYSSITGDGADLIFRPDGRGKWLGYIVVANKDFHEVALSSRSFCEFSDVKGMSVNHREVRSIRLRFSGWTGLAHLFLNEQSVSVPEKIELSCDMVEGTHIEIELPSKSRSLPTNKFSPLPDDFYTQTA